MNLEILQQSFPTTANPGIDTLDPRWAELSSLMQEGKFREAAEQSHALLQEGIYDVRLIGYLCFGGFLEHGPAQLAEVFAGLARVLDGNWEAVGPAKTRAKTTQQSLGWLFKQILRQLQHAEQAQDDDWQAWTRAASSESLDETLSQAFLLQQALEPRLAGGAQAVLEPLGKLRAWLTAFAAAQKKPEPQAPAPSPEVPTAAAEPTAQAASAPAASAPSAEAGSYHLRLLLRKIEALGKLLDQQKLLPARIVADDINEQLSRFDPLLYFPSLFAGFARTMARHAESMAELQLDPEAPPVRALRNLYHVDLDDFLRFE